MSERTDHRARFRIRVRAGLALCATSVALLLLVEGATSFLVLLNDGFRVELRATFLDADPERAQSHLRHDPDLGWTGVPESAWPNLYGRGRDVHVDAAGFRCGTAECAAPDGDQTVVACSGDSFAFGFGVGDEDAWCSLIAQAHPGVHTVNLAEPGYGVGQTYLRYVRDLSEVDHDLLLFSMIGADFRRLASERFEGVRKPLLRLGPDGLQVVNVPVSPPSNADLRRERVREAVSQLRLVSFFRRVGLGPGTEGRAESIRNVSAHMFLHLQEVTRERGVELVLVYLPIREEYFEEIDYRREHVRAVADSLGIAYVDLVDALQELDRTEIDDLFLRIGESSHPGAPGHYSELGNAWVARELGRRLGTWITINEGPGL